MELPGLPSSDDLVMLDAPGGKLGYEYLLDRKSVNRGSDDVMRYTVVIRSPTGTENVFFEGIRCETDQVRTYAYASSGGTFVPVNSDWGPIAARGARGYQDYLLERVVCDPRTGFAWDADKVEEALSAQYTSGGVRIERFCGNQVDCQRIGKRF